MSFLLGATLPQFTSDPDRFVDAARRAEASGLDSIWVFDHLWPLSGGKERPVLEAWSSLAYLAAATSRIRIGTLVTRSSLRHAAVLAKMIASVAEVAPGRLTVAVGSGDHLSRAENEAFGLPYFEADERIDEYAETFEVLFRGLTQDEVTFHGSFVDVTDLPVSPRPEARPLLWAAGRSDDVIDVGARLADGWNGWGGSPERFAQDAQSLLAKSDGRQLELSWGATAILGDDDDDAERKLGSRKASSTLFGGPHKLARELTRFVEVGAAHVVVSLTDPGTPGQLELLAGEVREAMTA